MRREKGQALFEMLICIPLFILVLAGALYLGRIGLIQLELADLCRSAAILKSRLPAVSSRYVDQTLTSSIRAMASQNDLINPQKLQVISSLSPAGASLFRQAPNGPLTQILKQMSGETVTVTYSMDSKGIFGVFSPRGKVLSQKLTVLSGDWHNPGESLITSITQGLF